MEIIIRQFEGVITDADQADIPKGALTECENMYPLNGRLIKDFGFGNIISSALLLIDNIHCFVDSNLSGGFLYVAVLVAANNTVVVKGYNGSAWVDIDSITGIESAIPTVYHLDDQNTIIETSRQLRILPGNTGVPDGTNEAKGIWLGYVDYSLFDGLYDPTDGFYPYTLNIDKPDPSNDGLDISVSFAANGLYLINVVRFYKFSYVYDGIQESLLSDYLYVKVASNLTDVQMDFLITHATWNKRITSIKVYRSDAEEGTYSLIHIIDMVRANNQYLINTTGGGYSGQRFVYVPAMDGIAMDTTTENFRFTDLQGTDPNAIVGTYVGSNFTVFELTTPYSATTEYDTAWTIEFETIASPGVWVELGSGSTGAYYGDKIAIIDKDAGHKADVTTSFLYFDYSDTLQIRRSLKIFQQAIQYQGATLGDITSAKPYKLITIKDGMYAFTPSGSIKSNCTFYDMELEETTVHPLEGEVSLKVNSKFSRIISGRLWQANVTLDPGGKNEIHEDWATYSELDQLDVNPVSNSISFADSGGAITGLEELYKSPVIMTNQTLFRVDTVSSPNNPLNWVIGETIHGLGNLARFGSVVQGNRLYVCDYGGIYQLTPNDLAESDLTPTKRLKITDAIQDKYDDLSVSQKKAILAHYNDSTQEIFYLLGSEIWAYDIALHRWREKVTSATPAILTLDENTDVVIYDSGDGKVYASSTNEAVGIKVATKIFLFGRERKGIVQRVYVSYSSATALTLNAYIEKSGSAAITKTLPISTTETTVFVYLGLQCRRLKIEIVDSALSTTSTIINEITLTDPN